MCYMYIIFVFRWQLRRRKRLVEYRPTPTTLRDVLYIH